jgi:hypothetical protein
MLCLGLSNTVQAGTPASAANEQNVSQTDRRQGHEMSGEIKGSSSLTGKTIKGEVMSIKSDNLVVKGEDGNEMRLQIDDTTQMGKNIVQSQSIEAVVNDQGQALSILSAQAVTDRRNDKE